MTLVAISKDKNPANTQLRDVGMIKKIRIHEDKSIKAISVSYDGNSFTTIYNDSALVILVRDLTRTLNNALYVSQDGQIFPETPLYYGPGAGFQIEDKGNNLRAAYISPDGTNFPQPEYYFGTATGFQIEYSGNDKLTTQGVLSILTKLINGELIKLLVNGTQGQKLTPTTDTVRLYPVNSFANKEQDENVVGNVLDDNDETRWSAEGEDAFADFDFEKIQEFSKIEIAFYKEAERTEKYQIAFSIDGDSYNTTEDVGQQNQSAHVINLEPPVKTRYIKIICQGNDKDKWNSITSIRFYGRKIDVEPPDEPDVPSSITEETGNEEYDKNNVQRLKLTTGLKYGNESYDPKPDLKKNGSYRLVFRGRRDSAAIGGYFKVDGPEKEDSSAFLGGGKHTDKPKKDNKKGRSYCIGIALNGSRVRVRKEWPHNNYHDCIEEKLGDKIGNLRKKWVGYQFLKINTKKDGEDAINLQAWVDLGGLDQDGKPKKNEWKKILDVTDTGNWNKKANEVWLTPYDKDDAETKLRTDEQDKDSYEYKNVFVREIQKS